MRTWIYTQNFLYSSRGQNICLMNAMFGVPWLNGSQASQLKKKNPSQSRVQELPCHCICACVHMCMHTVCCVHTLVKTSHEVVTMSQCGVRWVLWALSHDALLSCAHAHCRYMCVLCCYCIAEGGSESPETSSEFLSRVNPSILELPDPTHSLSALPEGRDS